jgi:curved DNA-binding protein
MEFIDYYKILGLSITASEDEIKKVYRKMARKSHPDLNPDDKDAQVKFQQLNEANTVLSNPENRKKYDKYGKDWERGEEYETYKQQQGQSQQQYDTPGQQSYGNFDGADFSDFFSSMFGQKAGRASQRNQGQFRG